MAVVDFLRDRKLRQPVQHAPAHWLIGRNIKHLDAMALPTDALRQIFTNLDWRTLRRCCSVSTSWHSLILHDDALWARLLQAEFYRPSCLLNSGAWQPAGWQKPQLEVPNTSAAAAAAGAAHADAGVSREAPPAGQLASGWAKDLFATGVLHAAGPHQAYLAQFHAALSQVTGYRLILKADHEPAAGAAAAGQAAYSLEVPDSGHPVPITADAVLNGGWAVGCVMVQQQEQSVWLRFNLPPELRQEPYEEARALMGSGRLAAIVQALGPGGWFDVASSTPFKLQDNDMEILIQSHQTGLYAWDHAEEGGVDRYGQLEPLPWDLAPGEQQQQQGQQPPQVPPLAAAPGQEPGHQQMLQVWQQQEEQQEQQQQEEQQEQQQQEEQQQQQQQLQLVLVWQDEQQQEQQLVLRQVLPEQQQQLNEAAAAAAAEAGPQLRMLAYVHYEQLLQALPWQLPHGVPHVPRPVLKDQVDLGMHLLSGGCALWLQLDVCKLHGGHRLGSCVVPLELAGRPNSPMCVFRCIEQQVLVSLYDPSSSINSTAGDPLSAPAAAEANERDAAGASGANHSSQAGAATATAASGVEALLGQGACRQVLLGSRCLHGAGQCSEDGTVIASAADALRLLMGIDEIMCDFALFDAAGHLLLGRAGVEVWCTEEECEYMKVRRAQDESSSSSTLLQPGDAMQSLQQQLALAQLRQPAAVAAKQLQSRLHEWLMHLGLLKTAGTPPRAESEQARSVPLSDNEPTESMEEEQEAEVFTRDVHRLHFLVNNEPTSFWQTGIAVDAARAPPHSRFLPQPRSTVSLTLPYPELCSLFGFAP